MPGSKNTRNRGQRRQRRRAPRRDDRALDIKIRVTEGLFNFEISKVLDTGTRRVRDSRLVAITLHGSATTQLTVLLRGDFVEGNTVTLCVIPSMKNAPWTRRLRMPRRVCNYFHDPESDQDASRILFVTDPTNRGGTPVDYVTFHFLQESNPVLTYNVSDSGTLTNIRAAPHYEFQLDGQSIPSHFLFTVLHNNVKYLFRNFESNLELIDPTPSTPPDIPVNTPLDWKIE